MAKARTDASRRRIWAAIGIWGLSIAAAALLKAAIPAHAQAPRNADPQRAPLGWDGRPATRSCHAEPGDLRSLKTTLIEHEKARIGFRNKVRHGVYSGQELNS